LLGCADHHLTTYKVFFMQGLTSFFFHVKNPCESGG
jgi:hypothetical protein